MLNENSLDTVCAALAYAMGIEAPACAAPANRAITEYVDRELGGKKVDRLLLFNPDAVAQWISEKYPEFIAEVIKETDLQVPLRSVMPSVTPVCFGTFYTGAQPEVHGIQAYAKPVITIDTLFDAAIRAGKKIALVAVKNCSIARIFLEREMDYFITDDCNHSNAIAAKLILEDKHDIILVYNGNYDSVMHKNGPESARSLAELRSNAHAYAELDNLVRMAWGGHDTLLAFAMDHGAHEIDGECGSHGLDMPEDLNIKHFYKIRKAAE